MSRFLIGILRAVVGIVARQARHTRELSISSPHPVYSAVGSCVERNGITAGGASVRVELVQFISELSCESKRKVFR